jgi:hypothetical protein
MSSSHPPSFVSHLLSSQAVPLSAAVADTDRMAIRSSFEYHYIQSRSVNCCNRTSPDLVALLHSPLALTWRGASGPGPSARGTSHRPVNHDVRPDSSRMQKVTARLCCALAVTNTGWVCRTACMVGANQLLRLPSTNACIYRERDN